MQRINQDIKAGQFRPAYLIYGEENYLIKQYKEKLRDAMLGGGDSMNLNRFQGKGVSVPQMIDMAETMPFFAEKRVILVENTELFKTGGEQLADYLEQPPESTCFIFAEQTVDKRSKLYKTVAKIGTVVEMKRMDTLTLKKWVGSILMKENKKITGATMELFLEKTGDDMENIQKELEKLICYCLNKEVITSQDVEEICVHRIQNQIFDMITAMALGRSQEALTLYYDLLSLREPPLRILSLISRQFTVLLQVKELARSGAPKQMVAEKVGIPAFAVDRYRNQAKGFTEEQLKTALNDCAETDFGIKRGRITDRMGVELLIVQYSSGRK